MRERDKSGQAVGPRAVWEMLLYILGLAVLSWVFAVLPSAGGIPLQYRLLVRYGAAAVWLALGLFLVGRLRFSLSRRLETAELGTLWRGAIWFLSLMGYVFVVLESFIISGVNPDSLLVGGAVTGVVVGLAAQTSLGNVFAGLVILVLHPYQTGERITCRTWMFGGNEYVGTVSEINLFYTILEEDGLRLVIPNTAAVSSVVILDRREGLEVHKLDLPYAVSLDDFKRALEQEGVSCLVKILAFGSDAYTVRVLWPGDVPLDVLRQVRLRLVEGERVAEEGKSPRAAN